MKNLCERTTEEVLEHHILYCNGANLEETLVDYCDETTLINMGGPKHGLDEIRAFFKDSIATCLPAESTYEDVTVYIDGEMAYTIWTAESPFYSIPYGTDTFIVRNGKIVQQTFAGILNQK